MARIDLQGLKKTLEESISILKSWLSEYDTLITSIKQDAEVIKKSLAGINSQSAEGINALNKAVEETEKLVKDREKTDKKRIQTQRELKKIEAEQLKLKKEFIKNSDEEVKGRIRLRKVQAEQKKLLEAEIILQKQEVNTQAERAERLKALTIVRDRLNTSTDEGRLKAKKYKEEIEKLTEEVRKNSVASEKQRMNIGNYKSALDNLKSSFFNLKTSTISASSAANKLKGGFLNLTSSLLPVAGGVAAIGAAINKQISLFRSFGLGISKVQATTGATSEEIERLENLAKRLGATTQFTASQVAELQLNFSKLGFTVSQIESATEATLNLAAATDTDLAQAAEVAASTINGIGLTAADTGRVTDVLALSFNSTALDIDKFRESIKDVAPFAKATGSSIEETTAALGVLADAGISGTQAGTGLKQIFREIKEDGRPLAETLKDLQKEFSQVTSESEKLALAEEKVGKISQAQLLILVDQADKLDNLKMSFDGAAGAAAETARVIQDNLEGDIRALNSAFEGLLLEGSSFNEFLRGATKAATRLISAIAGIEKETKDYSNGLRDEVSLLRNQQTELNNSLNILTRNNISQQQRNDLIDDIIKRFPQYNDVLNKENLSLSNIDKTRELLNKRMEESILLKIKEATQTEILTKKAEAQITIQRARVAITAEEKKLEDAQIKSREDLIAISEQNIAGLLLSIKLNEGIIKGLDEQLLAEGEILDSVLKRVKGGKQLAETERSTKKEVAESNEEYKTRIQLLGELFNKTVLLNKELSKPLFEQKPEEVAKLNSEIERLKELLGGIGVSDEKKETKKKDDPLEDTFRTRIKLTKDLEVAQRKLNKELAKAEGLQSPEKIAQLNSEIENLNNLLGREEALERIKDNTKQALDFISKETDKVYSRQISRIDDTIQKSKEQQDRLQEAIENGSKLGEKSLAEEIRREQEAAAQKEKLLKQQAQLQAFTAGAEVLSANDGDINQTFKDLASLKLFTNTLASAYEGTDDTGTVSKPLDSNGGRLMLIHDNEMILNKREKAELASLGYNTRNDLLNLARSTSLDSIQNGGNQFNVLNDNKGVEKRLDRMNDNIKRFSRKVSGTNNQTDNFSILLTKQNLYNSAKAKANSKWGR